MTRLSSHGPGARAEFKRLVLESQIGLTESELAARRSRHQRLRARRVERRLATLRSLLGDLEGREHPVRRTWLRSRAVGYLVSAVWLAGATALGVEIVRHGLDTVAATVGVIAMLALSLLWFAFAVARTPLRDAVQSEEPSQPAQRA